MFTAFVLVNTEEGAATAPMAAALNAVPGVSELHETAGEYELIAVLRAPSQAAVEAVISTKIAALPGVKKYTVLHSQSSHSAFEFAKPDQIHAGA